MLSLKARSRRWVLRGDAHDHPNIHGGPNKAILIIASEVVDALMARGYPLFYGAMGENLTTRGIDVQEIRIGDEFRVGGAVLEITQPRGPCSAPMSPETRSSWKSTTGR